MPAHVPMPRAPPVSALLIFLGHSGHIVLLCLSPVRVSLEKRRGCSGPGRVEYWHPFDRLVMPLLTFVLAPGPPCHPWNLPRALLPWPLAVSSAPKTLPPHNHPVCSLTLLRPLPACYWWGLTCRPRIKLHMKDSLLSLNYWIPCAWHLLGAQ